MSALEINITRVTEGAHEYAFSATASDLGLAGEFRGPASVRASLERRGRQFLVTAKVGVLGGFTCDRCLRTFDTEILGEFTTFFVPEGFSPDEPAVNDEVRVLSAECQVISLDDDVRQSVELAVPKKLLCREDCSGLCTTCGKDLNEGRCGCDTGDTDPRWEPLRTLSRS